MLDNVLPFRRNLTATLAKLIVLHSKMSAHELLNRHSQIINLRNEGYILMSKGLVEIAEIEPITSAMNCMHALARNAGIPSHVVKNFNANRSDWKAFEVERASLPRHQRI